MRPLNASSAYPGVLMPEILTESFCERCGTRYTFESSAPRVPRLKGFRVAGRGLKNFVMSDDTSLDEAFAAARSDTDREVTSQQLDAFHKTFNFCMSCRQYTCGNCWNEAEGRCLSCAPRLGQDLLETPFPDLAASGGALLGNGVNGHAEVNGNEEASPLDTLAWPTTDLLHDHEAEARAIAEAEAQAAAAAQAAAEAEAAAAARAAAEAAAEEARRKAEAEAEEARRRAEAEAEALAAAQAAAEAEAEEARRQAEAAAAAEAQAAEARRQAEAAAIAEAQAAEARRRAEEAAAAEAAAEAARREAEAAARAEFEAAEARRQEEAARAAEAEAARREAEAAARAEFEAAEARRKAQAEAAAEAEAAKLAAEAKAAAEAEAARREAEAAARAEFEAAEARRQAEAAAAAEARRQAEEAAAAEALRLAEEAAAAAEARRWPKRPRRSARPRRQPPRKPSARRKLPRPRPQRQAEAAAAEARRQAEEAAAAEAARQAEEAARLAEEAAETQRQAEVAAASQADPSDVDDRAAAAAAQTFDLLQRLRPGQALDGEADGAVESAPAAGPEPEAAPRRRGPADVADHGAGRRTDHTELARRRTDGDPADAIAASAEPQWPTEPEWPAERQAGRRSALPRAPGSGHRWDRGAVGRVRPRSRGIGRRRGRKGRRWRPALRQLRAVTLRDRPVLPALRHPPGLTALGRGKAGIVADPDPGRAEQQHLERERQPGERDERRGQRAR